VGTAKCRSGKDETLAIHVVAPSSYYSELTIDLAEISDWQTFHAVFKAKLGFPDFYGANMNAWIDCMTCLDSPDDGMTKVHAPSGGFFCLVLESAAEFKRRCPEIFEALVDCAAVVNYRRTEMGDLPVLLLSYRV
jgi:hypothetical protein